MDLRIASRLQEARRCRLGLSLGRLFDAPATGESAMIGETECRIVYPPA